MSTEETPNGSPESKKAKVESPANSVKRPSAEVLQRRKEGRMKAAQTIAENLKKTGIGRAEEANKFKLTSVKTIPLINQKNYFTEYLRKDEQVSFIRNWRRERLLSTKLKKGTTSSTSNTKTTNFDNFDLNEIEIEMKKNAAAAAEEDEEDDDNEEEIVEDKAKQGHDTIVIHLGSAYTRIGRATDAVPLTVPTVIAVKGKNIQEGGPYPIRETDAEGDVHFNEEFDEVRSLMTKDFKARMRFYKRRILPNSRETALNFNKKQEPERIPDHNDPYKKEWIDLDTSTKQYYTGEEALKLPIVPNGEWKLRYPIVNGNLNEHSKDYSSFQEILGDISNILLDALEELELEKNMLPQLKSILIIPDLYDKLFVEQISEILFKYVGFGKLAIIQESVAATFGAGALSACVVDVGAQTTSISCVDEGLVITDSRVLLNYGGDHITEVFIKMLLENAFPYKEIDISSRNDDWELAQHLKHEYSTFQDADIAVQLYNFYKRKPNQTTEKHEFKVFDEVMLAPLGLFYPDVFQRDLENTSIPSLKTSTNPNNTHIKKFFSPSLDQYTSKPNNPVSKSQTGLKTRNSYCDMPEEALLLELCKNRIQSDTNGNVVDTRLTGKKPKKGDEKLLQQDIHSIPLEKAIVESITNAGLVTDVSKIRKYYDNLLIVGGGFAKTSGCDLILSDRINIWRPKILSSGNLEEILNYVSKQLRAASVAKKELALQYKKRKQTDLSPAVEEIELTSTELDEIEQLVPVKLDLDFIDELTEKAGVLSANVLPPPREFDPVMLTWKGGSVYGRLKVVGEMWISLSDWDMLESRSLYYKSIFNY